MSATRGTKKPSGRERPERSENQQQQLFRSQGRRRASPASQPRRPRPAPTTRTQQGIEFPRGHFYATCHPGLERATLQDLEGAEWAGWAGIRDVQVGKSGVSFKGPSLQTRYAANLHLRSAIRVLEVLARGELEVGRASAGDAIYNLVRKVDWSRFIEKGMTFRVSANCWDNSEVTSSLLVCKRVRDAICDTLRDDAGWRPEDPRERGEPADVPLHVVVYRDTTTIYFDTSGESLHKRGYRSKMHKASLNEAAAAGLLLQSGLEAQFEEAQGELTIADPMCGSGTLLIEAGLLLSRTAPGLYRDDWPFFGWSDYDEAEWHGILSRAEDRVRETPRLQLLGNDLHPGAVTLARADANEAGLRRAVALSQGNCEDFEPSSRPGAVVTNPPWGQRLEQDRGSRGGRGGGGVLENDAFLEKSGLTQAWRSLGAFLRTECPEADAYVLSGSRQCTKFLRLAATSKHELTIGGINCRWLHYEINSLRDKRCFVCGEMGHISRDCPQAARKPN